MKILKRITKLKQELTPVIDPESKSPLKQWYEILNIGMTAQFTPGEYYLYKFHKKNKNINEIYRYIPNSLWVDHIWHKMNDKRWEQILQNKWLFHNYYKSLGLPVTNVYAYLCRKGGVAAGNRSFSSFNCLLEYIYELKPESLVVKPVNGGNGHFVYVFVELVYTQEKITGKTVSGKEYNLKSVIENILRHKRYAGVIIEEKLEQVEFFKKLNPSTINTIRLLTFFRKEGNVELLYGTVRQGRKGSEVDNFSKGGFDRGVDVINGFILTGGRILGDGKRLQDIVTNPDTGEPLKESKIPMWEQIVNTIREFAKATPFARIVGWDIALTANGPVIIEGNPDAGLEPVQAHSPEGFLTHERLEAFKEFGLELDNDGTFKSKRKNFITAWKRWL